MRNGVILLAVLSAAMFGMQACVSETSTTSARPPQYSQNQAGRTVCDADGNNCRPCDATTSNCQAATTGKYWGFLF